MCSPVCSYIIYGTSIQLKDRIYGEILFVCGINFSDINWEDKPGGKFKGSGKICLYTTNHYILSIEDLEDATDVNTLGSFKQLSTEFTGWLKLIEFHKLSDR